MEALSSSRELPPNMVVEASVDGSNVSFYSHHQWGLLSTALSSTSIYSIISIYFHLQHLLPSPFMQAPTYVYLLPSTLSINSVIYLLYFHGSIHLLPTTAHPWKLPCTFMKNKDNILGRRHLGNLNLPLCTWWYIYIYCVCVVHLPVSHVHRSSSGVVVLGNRAWLSIAW